MRHGLAFLVLLLALTPGTATAGPPYVTDDPEPVPYRHFEIYLASLAERADGGWSGTAPHLEVNYGLVPDLQLHLIVPAAYSDPVLGEAHYGLGDVELGAKLRFVQEGERLPQIGIFPLVEVPTGNKAEDPGSGRAQFLLPLWLQKSFGAWTTYGGFGYWLRPGEGNRDSWFAGWQIQRRLSSRATVGAEVFHTTPEETGGRNETRYNLGLVVDAGDLHHVLLSAGRGVQGPNRFQAYVAYQLTFGLRDKTRESVFIDSPRSGLTTPS